MTVDETPHEPLSLKERVYDKLIRFLTWLFRTDFFDVYRRRTVTWDEQDEIYRIGMEQVEDLKNEWLYTHQKAAEFYDDNEDDDWVSYCMWLVMRSDNTLNPDIVLKGERQEDGSWNHEVEDGPPLTEKEQRKLEILHAVDETGFLNPVLNKDNRPSTLDE